LAAQTKLTRELLGVSQRRAPAPRSDPEAVSLRLVSGVETVRKAIVEQPEAGDGIGGSTLITQQKGETHRSAQLKTKFNRTART
jgi:hypothetical protein